MLRLSVMRDKFKTFSDFIYMYCLNECPVNKSMESSSFTFSSGRSLTFLQCDLICGQKLTCMHTVKLFVPFDAVSLPLLFDEAVSECLLMCLHEKRNVISYTAIDNKEF